MHPNEAGVAYQNIYHELIRTKLILDPTKIQDGEAVFKFRGFQGTYDVALIDESGADVRVIHSGVEIEDNVEMSL